MSRAVELVCWAVLAVGTAGWLALVEVLWLPLRVDAVLVPVSVLGAAVGTPLLVGVTRFMAQSRVVAVLPALTWVAVALAASLRRSEGDLLVVGNGALGTVGLAFLLVGVVSASVSVGRVVAGPRTGGPRPGREPAEDQPVAVR